MSEKPQGNTPVPANDPLATVDREFRAMLARMTGGISPQDYGAAFADWWLFVLGGLFVLVTLFLPGGVFGLLQDGWRRSRGAGS